MELFMKYLYQDLGISKSRCRDLAWGIHEVHKSLCALDYSNLEKVADTGLLNLLKKYGELEQMRNIGKHLQEINDAKTRPLLDLPLLSGSLECPAAQDILEHRLKHGYIYPKEEKKDG